jgi:hypothetical protein
VGKPGGTIAVRHHKHMRYIKTNNPISAYALHILDNRHEYGSPEHNTQLLQTCDKGKLGIILYADTTAKGLIDRGLKDL